jgi:hypothetical protein
VATSYTTRSSNPADFRYGNNKGLTQAYELRDLAIAEAKELRERALAEDETPSTRAQAISAMIRAWDVASSRIRVLRGRPLPGSLRPVSDKPKRKPQPLAPTEEP